MNNRKELSATRQVGARGPTGRKPGSPTRARGLRVAGWKPPATLQRVQRQLGKKIGTLRERKGLTSGQLAKGCGVTALKISKIEDGQVNVALSTTVRLSKRLGIRLDHLFAGIK